VFRDEKRKGASALAEASIAGIRDETAVEVLSNSSGARDRHLSDKDWLGRKGSMEV
jgi:hypothetical protein